MTQNKIIIEKYDHIHSLTLIYDKITAKEPKAFIKNKINILINEIKELKKGE